MYTVRGYSHPDLTPKVAKPTTNPSSDHDHHYYPPTPPSSTSPKLTTSTKPPSTPPPVVAPSPSLIHLIKTSITKTKTNSKLEWHPLPKFAGIDHSEQRINTTECQTWIKDIIMWKQPLHSWLVMAGCMTLAATLSSGEHELIMYHWMRMTGLAVWTLAICQYITSNTPRLLDALWIDTSVRAKVKAAVLTHDPGHEMIMACMLHYLLIESSWVIAILFCFITTKLMSAKCVKEG